MRSLLVRLAMVGLAGIALASCGTQNGSSPGNAIPNGAGGGSINVTQQTPPPGTVTGRLVDGGTPAMTAVNVTGTDTVNAAATPLPRDAGAGPVPATTPDPAADITGQHSITFTSNGQPAIFRSATGVNLTFSGGLPGQIMPIDYSKIVFYAAVPGWAIELVGGSGASLFDTRLTCTQAASGLTVVTQRYTCAVPAYGATNYNVGFASPVASGATTGAFTPLSVTVYFVETAPPASGMTFGPSPIDYAVAEQ